MCEPVFSIEHFNERRYFKNARLWQKRYYKNKTDKPQCFCCGTVSYCRYEEHHIAMRDFHQLIILVCVNCHDFLTDWQISWPDQISNPPSKLEINGRLQLGTADALELASGWLLYAQNPNDKIEGSDMSVYGLSQLYMSLAIAIRKRGLSLLQQAHDIANTSQRTGDRESSTKRKIRGS